MLARYKISAATFPFLGSGVTVGCVTVREFAPSPGVVVVGAGQLVARDYTVRITRATQATARVTGQSDHTECSVEHDLPARRSHFITDSLFYVLCRCI